MAELVVALTLFRIGQDAVGLVDLLHLFFAFFHLVRMKVGVVLSCHFAVCLLDLVLTGTTLQTQHFIIISLISHTHSPPERHSFHLQQKLHGEGFCSPTSFFLSDTAMGAE